MNELMRLDVNEYGVMQSMAKSMVDSGFFSDIKQVAQAMVKIQAGREIGLPPFASMTGIHIVNGKPTIGANLIATLVKNDPRYDYRVKRADNQACTLTWYEGGKAVGESTFTIEEANAAGLTTKATWKAYASDMLFARALTRGARRFAPGIFGGSPIYTPDELGVDTDADGHIIDVTPTPALAPAVTIAPPPSDEDVTIREASARDFVNVAAALLDTDPDDLKGRLKNLGYTGIPGKPDERVKAYHALKDAAATAQDDLFGDEPQPVGNGAYSE